MQLLPETYLIFEMPADADQIPEMLPLIELGARPGCLIYASPGDRLEIHLTYPAAAVPRVLGAFDHLILRRMSPPLLSGSPAELLRRAVGSPEIHQPVVGDPWEAP